MIEKYLSEITPILELAFRGGGNGILWITIGAISGLFMSIALIVALFQIAKRHSWPTEEKWGKLARIALLFYFSITIPTIFLTSGAGLGLLTATISGIVKNQLIEKASAEGLNELVAVVFISSEFLADGSHKTRSQIDSLIEEYTTGRLTISVQSLVDRRDKVREAALLDIHQESTEDHKMIRDNSLQKIGRVISRKVWLWIAETRVDISIGYVDKLIANIDNDPTTSKEIANSIGELFVKPYVMQKLKKSRSTIVALGDLD